jgi:hypothetical protein
MGGIGHALRVFDRFDLVFLSQTWKSTLNIFFEVA